MDPDYIEMMNYIENNTDLNDISLNCELKQMGEFMDRMSIVALDAGTRLIVKDGTEVLMIPMKKSKQIIDTLHFSHSAADSMIIQCKRKIFWPGMKKSLQKKYEEYEQSHPHKATPHNQVSSECIFQHFMPGQRLQVDYAEKGTGNYLMIVDSLIGFMQAYKTPRKSTEDAIKCLRDWACHMK